MSKQRKKKGQTGGKRMNDTVSEPRLSSRFDTERHSRMMKKILDGQNFNTVEEMNAFLAERLTGKTIDEISEHVAVDREDIAQEMAYRAMDAESEEEAWDYCQLALRLDPACTDALAVEARLDSQSPAELAARLRGIIRSAEMRWGEAYMEENRGHFWGMVETRPYMRARQALVEILQKMRQTEEAIRECEIMLELNPNDNQGIRDHLRGLYLCVGALEKLRQLNADYDESMFATWGWSATLERWLSGASDEAEKLARVSHKNNRHVAAFITGKKPFPDELSEFYRIGDENEAMICLLHLGGAWASQPEAIQWLRNLNLR